MQERLSKLWRPGQGVTIEQVEDNKFIFQFYHQWDMERILQEGSWTFDGFLLVLRKVNIGEAIADTVLDEVKIWAQVFNIPFGFMHEDLTYLVGCHMGRYVSYDINNYYRPWRMYMRIRVALNVNEPLKTCMVFEKEDGNDVNLSFKNEKLGVFCYCCGILGHTDNFCPKRFEPDFVEGVKGWGKFLLPGNPNIGGVITVNKWTRGGRMAGRGGGDGGRGGAGNINGRGVTADNPINVVVTEKLSEHSLFGRVRVLREKGFNFHRMVTSFIGHNGGGEGQWIPFELTATNIANQITIMRLVNGIGAGNKGMTATNVATTDSVATIAEVTNRNQLLLTGTNCNGVNVNGRGLSVIGCNQVLGPTTIDADIIGTSDPGSVVCARKKDKVLPIPMIMGPIVIREGQYDNYADEVSSAQIVPGKGKEATGPTVRKRNRPNVTRKNQDDVKSADQQEVTNMIVDNVMGESDVGNNIVHIQLNPLFTENIVMAEAEKQPRQQP